MELGVQMSPRCADGVQMGVQIKCMILLMVCRCADENQQNNSRILLKDFHPPLGGLQKPSAHLHTSPRSDDRSTARALRCGDLHGQPNG
jgi:hypothetical protein